MTTNIETGALSIGHEIGEFVAFASFVIHIVVCMVTIIFGGFLAAVEGKSFRYRFFTSC